MLKTTERPPTKRIRTFVWPRRGGLIACGSILHCVRHGGSGRVGKSKREGREEGGSWCDQVGSISTSKVLVLSTGGTSS